MTKTRASITSKNKRPATRRPLAVETLEDRLVLDGEVDVVAGQILARVTSSAEISVLGEYLSELDWNGLLSPSEVENAAEVFHLHHGSDHQYVVKFFVDTSTDVVALAGELSTLSFLDYAEPNYIWVGGELASAPDDPGIYDPNTSQVYDFYSHSGLLDAWEITRGPEWSSDPSKGILIH